MQEQGPTAPQGRSPPPQAEAATPTAEPVKAKALADKIKERFPEVNIDYLREKRLKLTVSTDKIKDVSIFLKDQLGFDHISCVSGTDYIAKNEIEIIYFVGNLSARGYQDFIIALAERPKRDNPIVPSLVDVWLGAEYHERETYEMLGVNFKGHPNLKRLLLPEDWSDLPPLRKDYVSPGR